jgi:hypothetical protein
MKPTVSRIVHFVNGHNIHQGAMIVRVLEQENADDARERVNLQVFTDLTNDGETQSIVHATGVDHQEPADGVELKAGTWHWPERAE